jgi:hypothetical protein
MEQASNSISGARRNEDIALDLLKFVASTTGVGRTTAPSTGFVAATASKAVDNIDHLLDLYTRCLKTVGGGAR